MTVVESASAAFLAEHGRSPQAVWSAPGRVNLIGEHTDYNDGLVLPFALPHRTAVAVAPREDGKLSVATVGSDGRVHHGEILQVDTLQPGDAEGWVAYPAGVAWALREAGIPVPGADLVISGEVPTGAGLSSSAAIECAVALALLDISGRAIDGPHAPELPTVARWAQRAENDFAGAPTGLLDQTASLCCRPDHVLFFDVRSGDLEQIPFAMDKAGLQVLVIDTRAQHSHSESGYGDRRQGCERAAELLGLRSLREVTGRDLASAVERLPAELAPLVRHVVTENERVLSTVDALRAGEPTTIGPLLTESHLSLRDDFQISCTELDLAVDTALEHGALGARMIGGGFGGSAIALVNSGDRERVQRAVSTAFAEHELPAPRSFVGVPSAGAGRDRLDQ